MLLHVSSSSQKIKVWNGPFFTIQNFLVAILRWVVFIQSRSCWTFSSWQKLQHRDLCCCTVLSLHRCRLRNWTKNSFQFVSALETSCETIILIEHEHHTTTIHVKLGNNVDVICVDSRDQDKLLTGGSDQVQCQSAEMPCWNHETSFVLTPAVHTVSSPLPCPNYCTAEIFSRKFCKLYLFEVIYKKKSVTFKNLIESNKCGGSVLFLEPRVLESSLQHKMKLEWSCHISFLSKEKNRKFYFNFKKTRARLVCTSCSRLWALATVEWPSTVAPV